MKRYNLVAMMLGAIFIAAPQCAVAAEMGASTAATGAVCGRVDAPASYILKLALSPTHDNVIIARSQSEEVQTTVNVDGSFCFKALAPDLHTLVAFNDGLPDYARTIMPRTGRTLYVQLTQRQPSL